MTLIRYMLEYTIEKICSGNRSDCARRMGLSYQELVHFRKRMQEGSYSPRITASLLEMYWRESISVDEVLHAYTESNLGTDFETAENICSEMLKDMHAVCADRKRLSQNEAVILRAAESFLREVEKVFCDNNCIRRRYQDIPCPISQFTSLLQWLTQELIALGKENTLPSPAHLK
ncbi:MAG: hypothetical protein J6K55_14055 [Clostridia bacterium]|nr:hypothetical protein [Clostridia bacterium]